MAAATGAGPGLGRGVTVLGLPCSAPSLSWMTRTISLQPDAGPAGIARDT
jgi:hypothetical protein